MNVGRRRVFVRGRGLLILGLMMAAACRREGRQPAVDQAPAGPTPVPTPAFVDPSPHRSGRLPVNGINLHYLEWGKAGAPALVMIHGIGDDPHVFDDLADRLQNEFHIVAYARRGHGQSDAPAGPYDLATLVDDLRLLMDALAIPKASLLGWSMGGNEITQFAALYTDRVDKLVYLESGYDWTNPVFLQAFAAVLAASAPAAADLRSLDAYRDWMKASWFGDVAWTPGLEAYLRDTVKFRADGAVEVLPGNAVFEALFASLGNPPRDYAHVRAPALLLYSPVFFPPDPKNAERDARIREFEEKIMVPLRKASSTQAKRELKKSRVEVIDGTNHMSIGVRNPDALAAIIRAFLLDRSL